MVVEVVVLVVVLLEDVDELDEDELLDKDELLEEDDEEPELVGELGPGPEPVLDEAELELVAVVVPPCVSDGGTCR